MAGTDDLMDATPSHIDPKAHGSHYLNGGLNGISDGVDVGDEDRDAVLFLEAISRIEQLEEMKNALDDRESKLKANLRARHEEEKVAIKVSSELLVEKECLKDELIRLKDAREKLIDELQVLKSVDEEMSAFNHLNEQFNENLKNHLKLIEEKQAKIYTLKPIITGTHVAVEANLTGKEAVIELQKSIQTVIQSNIDKIKTDIRRVCDDNHIHTTEDWNSLVQEEKTVKQRIRQLKAKIKDRQKGKARDDQSEDSASSSKRKRGAADDDFLECEGCGQSFPTEDQERYAYHCFRGCSKLEDYLKSLGREVSIGCRECGETITSFMSFHDHMKNKHGYDSPEDPKGSRSNLSRSGSKKRSK